MTRENEIKNKYFDYLVDIVDPVGKKTPYKKMLSALHKTVFECLPFDSDRESDGMEMRKRFYDDTIGVTKSDMRYLNEPCSVLEMMVALALRCEETIMDDPKYGNRTKQWFWEMIKSLGLKNANDRLFDEGTFNRIMEQFLHRQYSRDGKGGLFMIKDCRDDLTDYDIFTQLCWYINSIA